MEDVLPAARARRLPKLPTPPVSAPGGMDAHPTTAPAVEYAVPADLDLSDDGGRWESADRAVFGWLIGATALLALGVVALFTAFGR